MSNLLNTSQAAHYLGISPSTLEHWRMLGKGPNVLAIGPRMKRYRKIDLDQWVESCVNANERPRGYGPANLDTYIESTREGGQS